MNFLKSALMMFAFLAVGIGTGLLVRVGVSAAAERGVEVSAFDHHLVGIDSASLPGPLQDDCPGCDASPLPAASDASSTPAEEARLIAETLDMQTVPLFVISGQQLTQVESSQLEPGFGASRTR